MPLRPARQPLFLCCLLMPPLGVVINGKFKQMIHCLKIEHMHQILEQNDNNSLSTSKRHVLVTGWVGAAWVESKIW